MTEYQDPPLHLLIESMRWMGNEWERTGEPPAPFELWGTDSDETSAAVLRLLRKAASQRLDMSLLGLVAARQALDFDAPNFPTEDDLRDLIQHAEHVSLNLAALKHLAPELLDDDEDEGDPEPEPNPAGSESV